MKLMGRDCEIVEMPPALASRVYRGSGAPAVEAVANYDITKIKSRLGYSDVVPVSRRPCLFRRVAAGEQARARGRDRDAARRPLRL